MVTLFKIGLLMFSVFYLLFYGLRALHRYIRNKQIPMQQSPLAFETTQEDPATAQSISNTRKAFREQAKQMNERALIAHDASCQDNWSCDKNPCFIWQPDAIVGDPQIEKVKTKSQRIQEATQHWSSTFPKDDASEIKVKKFNRMKKRAPKKNKVI